MAPTLILRNNNAANPLTLDLSQYLDLTPESDMDPQDPAFSNKVISHSLLKEGGVLALEDLLAKELVFPVKLRGVPGGGISGQTALANLIAQINQVITSPGATYSWQTVGVTQPTIFDAISGELDVKYKFREEEQFWCTAELKLFAQPLGRTAGPRPYAAASGVGPLLMISPYASGGALAIGASTQAGVAGYGGQQQPSGGVFYAGAPSLAGDAAALLQISYVGPLPTGASLNGVVPYAAVSLLPDQYYQPLIPANEIVASNLTGRTTLKNLQTAIASQYLSLGASAFIGTTGDVYAFSPLLGASQAIEPTTAWGGAHRLFAIARASCAGASSFHGTITTLSGPLVPYSTTASVVTGPDWTPYDLGTFSVRPSEYPSGRVQMNLTIGGPSGALDVAGLVVLPDNATWYMNPAGIAPSQFGYPSITGAQYGVQWTAYTNTLLLDDTLGDQFIYSGPSQTFAPSPLGMAASSSRVTQYTRGLVPRPDPKNGLPIIAILGLGQSFQPPVTIVSFNSTNSFGSEYIANPQNLRTLAQVNVIERARYILS